MFKFELRRAFEKPFFVAYLIGVLSGCGGIISYWMDIKWTPVESITCFDAWLYCYSIAECSAYKAIFPLVICLPYVTTIYTDRKSGFIYSIMSRTSYSRYVISKLIVGIIGTGAMSACVLFSWLVLSVLLFPMNLPATDLNVVVTGAFSEIYSRNPLGYIFILFLLNVNFAIVFYLSCVTISLFSNNKYKIVIYPFVAYFLLEFCAQATDCAVIHPIAYYLPFEFLSLNIMQIVVGTMLMVAINSILICFKCMHGRKEML